MASRSDEGGCMILFLVQLGMGLIFAGIVVAGTGHLTYTAILRVTISDLLDQVVREKKCQ